MPPCRGRRPAHGRAPAAHGKGLLPPSANPHKSGRKRRPRRSAQQYRTEASRPANPHSPCRGRRPRRPRSNAAFPANNGRIRRTFLKISPLLPGRRDAGPYKAAARSPPILPPAGEGGIRRSPARRMTEEGERDRLQTVKIVDLLPRLRSFPRRGPATFSLSCRPCGRHPPPRGEGRGEGAVDDINGPARPQRSLVGGGVPDAPAVTPRFRQTMGEFAERF